MSDDKPYKTPITQHCRPQLPELVAAIGAMVGASSDEIDAAIVELRKENRRKLAAKINLARKAVAK